jgi:hypothetical protein
VDRAAAHQLADEQAARDARDAAYIADTERG